MKKFLLASAAALFLLGLTEHKASAWVNSHFSVGLTWDYQSANQSILWGVYRNYEPGACMPSFMRNCPGGCNNGGYGYAAPYADTGYLGHDGAGYPGYPGSAYPVAPGAVVPAPNPAPTFPPAPKPGDKDKTSVRPDHPTNAYLNAGYYYNGYQQVGYYYGDTGYGYGYGYGQVPSYWYGR